MADREDFATAVGGLIKGRSPVGHTHTRIDAPDASLVLDSAGGVQHYVDGVRKFRIDATGTVLEGTVPWARIGGAPTPDQTLATHQHALFAYHAALAHAETTTAPVAFVGSSTTAQGYYARRFIDNLSAAYAPGKGGGLVSAKDGAILTAACTGPGVVGYNLGIGGSDTRDYLPAAALDALTLTQPVLIVHGIGNNDRARNMTPAAYETNVRAAVAAIDARVTVPHSHLFFTQQTAPGAFQYPPATYAAVHRKIAADIGGIVFNFGPALDRYDIYGTDPLRLGYGDGLHMNEKGGQVLGELLSVALNVPGRKTADTDLLRDTGERNLTGLVAGADGGNLYVTRTGPWVTVDFERLSPATDGHWPIYTLPLGFRPQRSQFEYFPTYYGPLREGSIYTDGRIHVWNAEAGDTYRGGFRYRTTDAWPVTLPGSPT